jgi:hypothetical protein
MYCVLGKAVSVALFLQFEALCLSACELHYLLATLLTKLSHINYFARNHHIKTQTTA